PPRPRLAFRLGITGARPDKLDPAVLPALRESVTRVMRHVRERIAAMAEERTVQATYAPGEPLIRLFSPLAEGSDRIAAEAALAEGFRLEVPLPFPADEYEKTFSGDREAFHALLAAARAEDGRPAVLALDGRRDGDAEAGYRAVGRFVTRNADLLIAIWDGDHGKPGGTGEIVRYAVRSHVPVWWIDPAATTAPRLLLDPMDLEHPAAAPSGAAAEAALDDLLRAAIVPPVPGRSYHHTRIGAAAHWLSARLLPSRAPLSAYFAEAEESVRPRPWRLYSWVLDRIAPERDTAPLALPTSPPEPDDDVERPWREMYEAADRYGGKYTDRYRSSYVLVIALAALTVSAMGLALASPRFFGLPAGSVELIALLAIFGIVVASELRRWHERWIAYRLLAELCRKQRMLARLGWPLPIAQVAELARDPEQNGPPRDAWVGWYVTAMMRGAAVPHGAIAEHALRARHIGEIVIATQTDYHKRRARRSRIAARRLVDLGELAFGATLALVSLKLGVMVHALLQGALATAEHSGMARWVGFACTALAALSAGFVSLRAYAEFDLLHLQSARMLRVLAETKQEIEAIDPARPLAASSLGAALHDLALAMLQDVQGWSLLFRTKTPEPG
ncbi:MAG TPA: hypothetical protein VG848_09925, partial [Acetobacteraceae bacterium]|nr:hypothetical protein [Acetobacteraceae bacterium]